MQCHVGLYYNHFHKAHPCLLPKHLTHIDPWPQYLQGVVCLIGSQSCVLHRASNVASSIGRLLADCTEQTIEVVQARLLGAIFLHAMSEPDLAVAQLRQAVGLAYELGLNREEFATSRCLVDPLLAESARRTWWELYVVDGLFSGFHHRASFLTDTAQMGVMLPCDEDAYERATVPQPVLSHCHLRRRILIGEDAVSSYALRVEAVSILHRVLLANNFTSALEPESLHSLNALLSTWISCLPEHKTDPIGDNGDRDHMLFQAQMIILAASISLHLPRSGIFSFSSSTAVACTKENQHLAAFMSLNMHAMKAMKASQHLSVLLSLDTPGQSHTPFFICILALSAIVHLAAIAVHADESPDRHFDRLNQVLGLLKQEAKIWPLAAKTYAQLREVASAGCHSTVPPSEILIPLEGLESLFEHAWSMQFDTSPVSQVLE